MLLVYLARIRAEERFQLDGVLGPFTSQRFLLNRARSNFFGAGEAQKSALCSSLSSSRFPRLGLVEVLNISVPILSSRTLVSLKRNIGSSNTSQNDFGESFGPVLLHFGSLRLTKRVHDLILAG